MFYNGENSMPKILEEGKDELSLEALMLDNTVQVVLGTPRWGQRA